MGHFAKVQDGVVVNVIKAEQDFIDSYDDGEPGEWVKTSYNMKGGVYYDPETQEPAADQSVITGDEGRERKNYAVIGGTYDGVGFAAVQSADSWTLNSTTYLWEPPIPHPDDGNAYSWDESVYQADTANPKTQGWIQA